MYLITFLRLVIHSSLNQKNYELHIKKINGRSMQYYFLISHICCLFREDEIARIVRN